MPVPIPVPGPRTLPSSDWGSIPISWMSAVSDPEPETVLCAVTTGISPTSRPVSDVGDTTTDTGAGAGAPYSGVACIIPAEGAGVGRAVVLCSGESPVSVWGLEVGGVVGLAWEGVWSAARSGRRRVWWILSAPCGCQPGFGRSKRSKV